MSQNYKTALHSGKYRKTLSLITYIHTYKKEKEKERKKERKGKEKKREGGKRALGHFSSGYNMIKCENHMM